MGNRDMPEFSYAARRGRPALDPAMRRMALGAGGVSALVIVVALVWGGMKPGIGFGPPPVITAPPGPLRVAPANPGGLTVPEANVPIMSGDSGGTAPQLAPSGPAPALAQLSQAAGLAAAPQPAAAPAAPPAVAPAAAAPAAAAQAAAAPAAAVAPGAGNVQVQLASGPNEADVENVWSLLMRGLPADIANRQPQILPAVVNGNSVWLLRLGGFADDAAAQAFCARLTANGAACSLAGP